MENSNQLKSAVNVKDAGPETDLRLPGRNTIVGFTKEHSMRILESLFWYRPGFHGATGRTMGPIEQDVIDDGNDVDTNEFIEECWKHAVENGETTSSLKEYAEQAVQEASDYGLLYPGDDPSFREDTEDAWDALPEEVKALAAKSMGVGRKVEIDSNEAYGETDDYANFVSFGCESCGRFSENWRDMDAAIVPKELLDIIDRFESKEEMTKSEAIELMKRADKILCACEIDATELKAKYGN